MATKPDVVEAEGSGFRLNPVSKQTSDKLGLARVSYSDMLQALGVTTDGWEDQFFQDTDKSLYLETSTKTIANYYVVLTSSLDHTRVCIKYIDPFSENVVSVDDHLECYSMPKFCDSVLLYEYPARKDRALCFVPVLFRLTSDNKIVKFKKEEMELLQDLAEYTWNYAQKTYSSGKFLDDKLRFEKLQELAESCGQKLGMATPIPEHGEVNHDSLMASMEGGSEIICHFALEGDAFCIPDLFDCRLAAVAGKKVDLHYDLNMEMLAELFGAQIAPAGPSGLSDILSGKKQHVHKQPRVVFHCMGVDVTYRPSTGNEPLIDPKLFGGLSPEEYFKAKDKSQDRLRELYSAAPFDPRKLPKLSIRPEMLLGIPDIKEVFYDAFFDIIKGKMGDPLLGALTIHLDVGSSTSCGIVRYNYEQAQVGLLLLYKHGLNRKNQTRKAKVCLGMIVELFSALKSAALALWAYGLKGHVSPVEMMRMLALICPKLFEVGTTAQSGVMGNVVSKVDTAAVSSFAKVLSDDSMIQKSKAKVVSSTMSTMYHSAASANTARSGKSTIRSGDSGYRSVSTGSRFSQASSYGTNCVNGHCSITFKLVIPDKNIVQNLIFQAKLLVTTNYEHVSYQDGDMVLSTWVNNPQTIRDQSIRVNKQDKYVRFYPSQIMVQQTTVELHSPMVDDVMDPAILDSMLRSGGVDVRAFSTCIMGSLRTTRHVAEKLAPVLLKHAVRYVNSAIYFCGYLLMMMLADMEEENIQPVTGVIPADSVVAINLVTINEQGGVPLSEVDRAMESGRVFLCGKELTQKDIAVMKLISAGPSALTTGVNCDVKHVGSTIVVNDGVQWAIYDDEAIEVPANLGRITSADVSAFLNKLWTHFEDSDARVSGFVQAAAAINGKLVNTTYKNVKVNRFVMSTLEIGRIEMARPRGHNFMWKALKLEPARESSIAFAHEAEELKFTNANVLNLTSVVVATYISLGVSTFLDEWNISGKDLNASVLPPANANNLNLFIDQLTKASNNVAAPIFTISCGFAAQVSEVTCNPLVWGTRQWCANMKGVKTLVYDEGDLWSGVWGNHVPYLVDVLASSFLLKAWPSIWHILAPDVTFEFTTEVIMTGPQELRQWDALVGDPMYKDVGAGSSPWKKVPYGGLAISALRQHLGVQEENWEITMQMFVGNGGNFSKVCDSNLFQPEFDEDFGIIKPGTLLTYSWGLCRSLVPALKPAGVGDSIFHAIATTKFVGATTAGIYLNTAQVGQPLNVGLMADCGIDGINIYSSVMSGGSSIGHSEN